jgi:hypothetical protein
MVSLLAPGTLTAMKVKESPEPCESTGMPYCDLAWDSVMHVWFHACQGGSSKVSQRKSARTLVYLLNALENTLHATEEDLQCCCRDEEDGDGDTVLHVCCLAGMLCASACAVDVRCTRVCTCVFVFVLVCVYVSVCVCECVCVCGCVGVCEYVYVCMCAFCPGPFSIVFSKTTGHKWSTLNSICVHVPRFLCMCLYLCACA